MTPAPRLQEGPRAAWREPMLWLAAALPLAVIAAAVATLAVARRAPADRVDADVRRIAQIQTTDLSPDREAARRGLRGRLETDASRGEVRLWLLTPRPDAAHGTARGAAPDDAARGAATLADGQGVTPNDVSRGAASSAPPRLQDDVLTLVLMHPVAERADRKLVLHRDGDAFRGTTTPWPPSQAWTLRVQPRDGAWRIGGRLAANASQATLGAAVAR